MGSLTTFLTFSSGGAEAVEYYCSLFDNAKLHGMHRHPGGGPLPAGALMHASFEIDGQRFMAMDGGDHFTFSEGTSILASAETQDEIDRLWSALTRTEASLDAAAGLRIAGACHGRSFRLCSGNCWVARIVLGRVA